VVQWAKERAIPALYFTNLISARPLFGPAGAGSLAATVNAAIAGRERFGQMREFFGGVGTGAAAGYGFGGVPHERPEVKERFRRHMVAQAKKRKAEEVV
jgi:chlorophyllide a reductase subunit Y